MAPADLKQQIARGTLRPLYFLFGPDEIEKADLVNAFVESLDEGLRPFNLDRMHGGDIQAGDLLDAARTLPMMAERRVIIVSHADALLVPRRESEAAERAIAELAELFAHPPAHATIVIVAADPDSRRKLVMALAKHAVSVPCGVLEDAGEARRWIKAQADAAGVRLEPAAVNLLAERGGTDAARLRAELDRARLFAGGKTVTADDVRAIAGEAELQDEWALARAIERSDAREALRELALLFDDGRVAQMILGQLAWVVRTKLPPIRVRRGIEAVFRTDLDLKRSGGDPRILMERLVVELCEKR
ncbi:MAG TPA: DNA polymerase III subunit delta [Vicinamibacterales bacterium]